MMHLEKKDSYPQSPIIKRDFNEDKDSANLSNIKMMKSPVNSTQNNKREDVLMLEDSAKKVYLEKMENSITVGNLFIDNDHDSNRSHLTKVTF